MTGYTPPHTTLKAGGLGGLTGGGEYLCFARDEVRGRSILLIDDVRTSGATLSECARALTDAGARSVCALTLAAAGK